MIVEEYLQSVPCEQKEPFQKLRQTILGSMPVGLEERIQYGMIGFVVPHSVYPAGYHCNPKDPLPFLALAAQKGSINFYHMGIYARPDNLIEGRGRPMRGFTTDPQIGILCGWKTLSMQ